VNPNPVLSKADFVLRYRQGEFGNASPTWDTIEEFLASNYNEGMIHIRNLVAGGPTWYDVPCSEVWEKFTEVVARHDVDGKSLYFSAMAPTHLTTSQGELRISDDGQWQLWESRVAKPMRAALEEQAKLWLGFQAKIVLKHYMNQKSWEWLEYLLEAYPGHIVEYSCYSRNWGTVPGYNTVFWEVRLY